MTPLLVCGVKDLERDVTAIGRCSVVKFDVHILLRPFFPSACGASAARWYLLSYYLHVNVAVFHTFYCTYQPMMPQFPDSRRERYLIIVIGNSCQ